MGKREITDFSGGHHSAPYEREETDTEWHGRVLEDIAEPQEDIRNSLQIIETSVGHIESHLGQIVDYLKDSQHPKKGQRQDAPMSTWRFIFSWAVIIVLYLMYITK